MSELNDSIVAAWLEAAQDLHILVVAPYRVNPQAPSPIFCEAFLPDFGSPAGAFVISSRSRNLARPVLRNAEGWHSELGDGYVRYQRKLFIETLNDWGWFGAENGKPDWYTGEPWS